MPHSVDPKQTTRAFAYEFWMTAPNRMNSGIFNNPFIIWGRYKKKFFRYYLTLSFQFHHTQMDGAHAGKFLANLQNEIGKL